MNLRGGTTGAISEGLVVLLILFLPWLEGGNTPLALFVSHSIVFVLLGAILWSARRTGVVMMTFGWESVPGVAFVLLCGVSFLGVDYFFGPFLSLVNVLIAALLALALTSMGADGLRGRAIAVATAGAVQSVAALLIPPPQNLTPMGTFANANQMSAFLIVAALVTAGLAVDAWRRGARFMSGLFAVAAALDLAMIVRAGARGALLAVLISGGAWIAVLARRTRPTVRYGLWGALIVVAVLGAAGVAARFDRIPDPYRFDRTRIWEAALQAGMQHPILGMGPGMFEARAFMYNFPLDREMFRYSKRINSAHSTYLGAFAATGFAGTALLAIFLTLLGWRLAARIRSAFPDSGLGAGIAFSTLACLVHGLVETPFEVPAVTWSLLALLVPLLAPADRHGAAALVSFRSAFPAQTAVLITVWAGAVLMPYAGHAAFLSGVNASRPGQPDELIDRARLLSPYNPLYPQTRAQITWRRDLPLTPAVLAASDLDLARAGQLDPGNPEPRWLRAQLHARACFEIVASRACVERAERYFRETIALGIRDPRPHAGLALFLLAQQRSIEGIDLLRQALGLEPRYIAARASLARALLEAGDRDEARAELARLEAILRELTSYVPKNGYEADLMKSDPQVLAGLRDALNR